MDKDVHIAHLEAKVAELKRLLAAALDQNHKPGPDVFLKAARRINITPRDCCAYEDTDLGIAAAKAADMDVVDAHNL